MAQITSVRRPKWVRSRNPNKHSVSNTNSPLTTKCHHVNLTRPVLFIHTNVNPDTSTIHDHGPRNNATILYIVPLILVSETFVQLKTGFLSANLLPPTQTRIKEAPNLLPPTQIRIKEAPNLLPPTQIRIKEARVKTTRLLTPRFCGRGHSGRNADLSCSFFSGYSDTMSVQENVTCHSDFTQNKKKRKCNERKSLRKRLKRNLVGHKIDPRMHWMQRLKTNLFFVLVHHAAKQEANHKRL